MRCYWATNSWHFPANLQVDSYPECGEKWRFLRQLENSAALHYGITGDFSSITCTSPFDAITAYDLQDSRCSV